MKNKNFTLFMVLLVCISCVNSIYAQDEFSTEAVINEDYKIVASDGSMEDQFGSSISIDSGIIAIGTPFDDDNGPNSGSAYLFNATTGEQIFKLLPLDGTTGAEFGFCIAIENGIVAVGAKGDNENGTNAGAAYLFDASTGAQITKLLPADGEEGDEFGNSIDINNGIVAVGAWRADEFGDASGAAYLFNASTGDQLDKILPDTGNNFQTFGVSIAIDNGIVAVGARTFFVSGDGYTFAKAYLFDVPTGNQLDILEPDISNLNGDLGGFFADCIDINDGLVAVGAPKRSVVFDHSGAAYIFDASTGSQLTYIVPDDAHDRDNFGISISIDNGIVAIGAHQDDENGFNSGSAYLFDALTGTEISKLLASDGTILDLFGTSIALEGGVAVVGAKDDDDNGDNSGSAYVYSGITLGISDVELDEISVYPNPGSNMVTIDNLSNIGDIREIRVYNNLGQLLKVTPDNSLDGKDQVILDVSAYDSGLYFINIVLDRRTIVKKLLVD